MLFEASAVSNRRGALRTLLRGAVCAATALIAAPLRWSPTFGRAMVQGRRVFVGDLKDFRTGAAIHASYDGLPVILTNNDGTVRGFLAICTHEGCIVRWSTALKTIQCPCHDGRFDLEGRVIFGPPPAPLPSLDVVVEGTKIFIATS